MAERPAYGESWTLSPDEGIMAMDRDAFATGRYWRTRDGRMLLFSGMSDEHLANAGTMLARSHQAVPAGMQAEFRRRGMATPCEHGWTDLDFCPECSDEVLSDIEERGHQFGH